MVILSITVFGSLLLAVGYFFGSNRGKILDYQIGEKKIGLTGVTFGIFSVVGAGEIVYATSLGIQYGWWSLLLFWGFSLGCIFFYPLTKYIRKYNHMAKEDQRYNLFSIPDLAYLRYGRAGSIPAAVLMYGALGSLLLIQLVVGSELLYSAAPEVSITTHMVMMALLVALYTIIGGFRGVLATDLPQFIVMFFVFTYLAFVTNLPGGSTGLTLSSSLELSQPQQMPVGLAVATLLGGIFWVIGGGDIWERLLAARDDDTARKALLLNAVALAAFGTLMALLAFRLAGGYAENPDGAFLEWIQQIEEGTRAVIALGLFAAILSTSDTEMLILSQILQRECSANRERPEFKVKSTMLLIATVALATCILAIVFRERLIDVYYTLLNIFVVAGMLALAMFLRRGNAITAPLTIGISILYLILVMTTSVGDVTGYWASVPLVVIMAANLLVTAPPHIDDATT